MELLVVEDEIKVSDYLKKSLEAEGHSVRCARTLGEAEAHLAGGHHPPDVVVLDRMLKGEDGLALLAPLKAHCPECRVLILSAVDMPEEKARALDRGADDYLAKPFSLAELSARLRALQRRQPRAPGGMILKSGDLTLDVPSQNVTVEGKRVEISKKEFQILVLLLQTPGRVFNKFQLLDKVWDMQFNVESNTVEVTIKNLRRKLADSGSRVEILSKRNVGYWIEA